jgi:hypothetical protein
MLPGVLVRVVKQWSAFACTDAVVWRAADSQALVLCPEIICCLESLWRIMLLYYTSGDVCQRLITGCTRKEKKQRSNSTLNMWCV